MGYSVDTPPCWIRSYCPTSTRCRFQVGIGADCYLRGAVIVVSQLAQRETRRFTLTFIIILFLVIVSIASHGALTGGPLFVSDSGQRAGWVSARDPPAAVQRS
eukprot:3385835-Pleurochrysis_carterae.AAC.1